MHKTNGIYESHQCFNGAIYDKNSPNHSGECIIFMLWFDLCFSLSQNMVMNLRQKTEKFNRFKNYQIKEKCEPQHMYIYTCRYVTQDLTKF